MNFLFFILGIRSPAFVPMQANFDVYLEERDHILQSPSRQVLQLKGGIVGQITAEVVLELQVLDGLGEANEVVGSFGNTVFINDGVDLETLDVMCSVYYVKVLANSTEAFIHSSFWLKQWIWESSRLSGD